MDAKPWILAGVLTFSLPDYKRVDAKQYARDPQVQTPNYRLEIRDPEPPPQPGRLHRPTVVEVVKLAADTLGSDRFRAEVGRTHTPNFASFSEKVQCTFRSPEARDNVYFHAPSLLDLRGNRTPVSDVSPLVLPAATQRNWTAIDIDPRRAITDRRIFTVSGAPAEREVELLAQPAKEIEYLLRHIDPNDHNTRTIVSVLKYVADRQRELEQLVETTRKLSPSRRVIEDVRGGVVYDAVKTIGYFVMKKFLGIWP